VSRDPPRGDEGASTALTSLLSALEPTSVIGCALEVPAGDDPTIAGAALASSVTSRDLASADLASADLVWIYGQPSWHSLRALGEALADNRTFLESPIPVVVVGGAVERASAWTTSDARIGRLERVESRKDGVRLAMIDLGRRFDFDSTVLSCAAGYGFWALLPSQTAHRLGAWLGEFQTLLATMNAAHRDHTELLRQNFELMTLLEQAQRDGMGVVRSRRFRIGSRLAHSARRVTRKPAFFEAPGRILRRQVRVERVLARLPDLGDSSHSTGTSGGATSVTYVLPELRLAGGALTVVQLVNELQSLGVDARIATLKVRNDVHSARLAVRPLVYPSTSELVRQLPPTNVLVATHWSTASVVRQLSNEGRTRCPVYFIQDYEAWFYPERDARARAGVVETYGLIPNRVVVSNWLQELLARDGYSAQRCSPGLDLGVMYPRTASRPTRPVVMAMARPRTPRRGYDTMVQALTLVHRAMPSAEFVLFGAKLSGRCLPFPFRGIGTVTSQERLARLLSRARVHVDASDFQGFGRTGLEAMACGAVSVLTDVGGVRDYARDGENALLVPPSNPDATARAILRLLSTDSLHQQLRDEGLATVRAFSMQREARETLALFESFATSSDSA
jgi:glycosyltransferase involved in cell wall biosynthesis